MESAEQDQVARVAKVLDIPLDKREWLRQRIRVARQEYRKWGQIFGRQQTRTQTLKELADIQRTLACALDKLKGNEWVIHRVIHHEAVTSKQGLDEAERVVGNDVQGFTDLVSALAATIEYSRTQPLNEDEKTARAGAAKPEQKVLDSYIISIWRSATGRPVAFGENSGFIAYYRVIDNVIGVSRARNGEDLTVETIRCRVRRTEEWLRPQKKRERKNSPISPSGTRNGGHK